ncbi:hypothetical protein Pmar_PMAR017144 [Perkinsus marinus ATCC 50983]|uniref:Uncharacterized protein n=1 Tax=Perkinsus marinus (strain ATCC 50983 / TXsc) TaxID=423536 RepID=C5LSP5_PERM5|nr:hypothetical protein Pmar_PMAR017144 [Perkinsus marinus ATCC 50983]EER00286.1 hypothetical protein Pmar_PMAR017144 [Perkinsus marinus ATCC 50983]|eukprot:XP_002767568.1 hypothetical protein Pmar_PMAR017144 [Perkinsus marinus ATCC 50983]
MFEELRVFTTERMMNPVTFGENCDAIFMPKIAAFEASNCIENLGGDEGESRRRKNLLKCAGPNTPNLFVVDHYAESGM